jgi:hypothetical protein
LTRNVAECHDVTVSAAGSSWQTDVQNSGELCRTHNSCILTRDSGAQRHEKFA